MVPRGDGHPVRRLVVRVGTGNQLGEHPPGGDDSDLLEPVREVEEATAVGGRLGLAQHGPVVIDDLPEFAGARCDGHGGRREDGLSHVVKGQEVPGASGVRNRADDRDGAERDQTGVLKAPGRGGQGVLGLVVDLGSDPSLGIDHSQGRGHTSWHGVLVGVGDDTDGQSAGAGLSPMPFS